ncbi:MAG: DUF3426 domain-containing protein [Gammaproteobacteria bacterium]|nr:DUF3426 domain-containing protein [Gammaproteobacteria bacterium]
MLTTCTACGTQFRVNTAQLRAVHGLVRCSRCHSVFDAFETLREEFEPTPSAPQATADELNTQIEAAQPAEVPLITPTDDAPVVENIDTEIQLQATKPETPADDLFTDLWGESPTPATNTVIAESVPTHADTDTPMLIEDHIPKPPALARDQALYKHVELPPRERPVPKTPRQPRRINFWGVGMVFMALLLGIQVVNANRLALSQTAVIGQPITSLYAALGYPVTPPPSPDVWQVNNINVTSDPGSPGTLSITGTLANSSNFPQPWPILRIALMDRYGDALRARDFTAANYLPASQGASLLNPGTAVRFRLDVVDPGPEAVGFQVQPCFDDDGSRICSSTTTD